MRQPSIYLPHGGGPCFFMDPPPQEPLLWEPMRAYLASLPTYLPSRPDALLVVSAHWEMPRPTVLAAARPELLFDYYNFPPHTYQLTYPAPGAPGIAGRVRELLADAGIDSGQELSRGYDHGVFVPLKVSFPDANIPIVQLSLQAGLDPSTHIKIGAALQVLRDENIVVIGSGMSFHNMSAFRDPRLRSGSAEFDRWLTHTVCELPVAEREAQLARWTHAPYARQSHPREEHLLPLMVAVGAAGNDAGRHVFSGTLFGSAISAFHFGS